MRVSEFAALAQGLEPQPRETYVIDGSGQCSCPSSRFRGSRGCKHTEMTKHAWGPARAFAKAEAREIAGDILARLEAVPNCIHAAILPGPDMVGERVTRVAAEIVIDEEGRCCEFTGWHRGLKVTVQVFFTGPVRVPEYVEA